MSSSRLSSQEILSAVDLTPATTDVLSRSHVFCSVLMILCVLLTRRPYRQSFQIAQKPACLRTQKPACGPAHAKTCLPAHAKACLPAHAKIMPACLRTQKSCLPACARMHDCTCACVIVHVHAVCVHAVRVNACRHSRSFSRKTKGTELSSNSLSERSESRHDRKRGCNAQQHKMQRGMRDRACECAFVMCM